MNVEPVTPTSNPSGMGAVFRQPRSVWAIAIAAVISFMGIGLVDPILKSISQELHASASQTMLLFTSYLFITGIAMMFTSFVSGRIGIRKTLLWGLALIVVFAGLCSMSANVSQIIGLRAGWGLGNALFISTALSAIIGATTGSRAGAVIFYEAAMGVGLAVGPLVGGLLGAISWRAPFAGTAILMMVGFITLFVLLKDDGVRNHQPLTAAFSAFRRPPIRVYGAMAFCYNFAFFVVLAYTPFPLEAAAQAGGTSLTAVQFGLVFFGWGLGLAISSVVVSPWLANRFGHVRTLTWAMVAFAVLQLAMALWLHHLVLLVIALVLAGLIMGVVNTALTEAVMESTDLPRNVASSAYSGVRFIGGAIAPAVAGPLAEHLGASVPFLVGGAALVLATCVLLVGAKYVRHPDHLVAPESIEEAEAVIVGAEV